MSKSLLASMRHLTLLPLVSSNAIPDVLIINGPGTCFALCIAALVNRVRYKGTHGQTAY
jgi:beta-1,4-N-acetylglucosaminyltransferase